MPDLGTRYECYNCGVRFYDLGRPEAICPKCGANQKDAKKAEIANETASAKRKRREEVLKHVDEVSDDGPSAGDDDFSDDEIETPEGVDDEDEPEDDDDE
ncbi:MAG: FYDLN acid domain-containing protein [Thermoanaerobaculia bacterium]